MCRLGQLFFLMMLCLPKTMAAQTEWASPPVCDVAERPAQNRFYQRGNAHDDAEEAESYQFVWNYLIPASTAP